MRYREAGFCSRPLSQPQLPSHPQPHSDFATGTATCSFAMAFPPVPNCLNHRTAPRWQVKACQPLDELQAVAGQAGVSELLANLVAELDLTLGLAGCRSIAELGPDLLTPAPGA